MRFVRLSDIERRKPIALDAEGNFLTVADIEANVAFVELDSLSLEEQQRLVLKRYDMEPDFAVGHPNGESLPKDRLMEEIRSGSETGMEFLRAELAYLSDLHDDLMGRSKRARFEDLIREIEPTPRENPTTATCGFVFADADYSISLPGFLPDVHKYKADRLAPAFEQAGTLVQVVGREDVRVNFLNAYRPANVGYISESGHGDERTVCGYDQGTILWQVDNPEYAIEDVEGKIVHLCSCLTANVLGPKLVDHKAAAYFGYITKFIYYMRPLEYGQHVYEFGFPFYLSDSGVDVFLLCGFNCENTAILTRALYDYWIDLTRSSNMFPGLVPSMLTYDKEAFMSPIKGRQFGRKDAVLDVPPLPRETTGRLITQLLSVPS